MMPKLFEGLVLHQSQKWHARRFQLLLTVLQRATSPIRSIVDLGGGNGAYMAAYAHLLPEIEIIVADIDEVALAKAHSCYGFKTVKLQEHGPLPFQDQECDLIFCNSVIEHITIPKNEVWILWTITPFEISLENIKLSLRLRLCGRLAPTSFRRPIELFRWKVIHGCPLFNTYLDDH